MFGLACLKEQRPPAVVRIVLPAVLAASTAFGGPGLLMACACCADPGERIETISSMTETEIDLLDRLRFGGEADFYLPAGALDDDRDQPETGHPVQPEGYALKVEMAGDRLVFHLEGGEGRHGSLTIGIPKQFWVFAIDPTPGGNGQEPVETVLRKEWSLATTVTGSGVFATSDGEPRGALLMLLGTGNRCDMAGDFTHWTLDVVDFLNVETDGDQDDPLLYRMYGRLLRPV